jgi:hypothetical protein
MLVVSLALLLLIQGLQALASRRGRSVKAGT